MVKRLSAQDDNNTETTNASLTTPAINGTITGTGQATVATPSTIVMRDANGNLAGVNLNQGYTTTATAAGTTTLTIASSQVQEFTGTSTQTVKLPTTSVPAGCDYVIINNSTGAVTVQSSDGNIVVLMAAQTSALFTSLIATPTTNTHWNYQYYSVLVTGGKKLNVSNTLTLAGTDNTTLTFPSTSDTLVGRASTDTLTNKTLTSPVINTPTGIAKGDVGLGNVDNTSDATKDAATTTLTNKTLNNTNTISVKGANFSLQKSSDPTSLVLFSMSNISLATTRTLTLPNANDTLVGLATTDTLTNKTLTAPKLGSAGYIADVNGNEVLKTAATVASAVNELTVTNAATGTSPSLTATGDDSNIDFKSSGKGTGKAYNDSYSEIAFDFVVSGLVWSGDAYASTRNASMTAGFAYISGVRVTVAAVTARAFTASKDTYIDLSSSGTLTYTEVANNAASPALAADNIRIGIIVTGASNIANVGSVNQGQESKVLPIASSVPYAVTDSLGNLICPRDPNRKLLGYRQILSNFATTGYVTGLSVPVIVPTGRKVRVTAWVPGVANGTSGNAVNLAINNAAAGGGSQVALVFSNVSAIGANEYLEASSIHTPASSSMSYSALTSGTGTITVSATSTAPAYISVELV